MHVNNSVTSCADLWLKSISQAIFILVSAIMITLRDICQARGSLASPISPEFLELFLNSECPDKVQEADAWPEVQSGDVDRMVAAYLALTENVEDQYVMSLMQFGTEMHNAHAQGRHPTPQPLSGIVRQIGAMYLEMLRPVQLKKEFMQSTLDSAATTSKRPTLQEEPMNFYDILGLDAAATEAIILDKSAALLLEIPTVAATMNDFFHPDRHQQRNTWEKYRRAARQCPHYDSWMRTALDRGTANPKLQQALKLEILKIEPGPEQQIWWEMLADLSCDYGCAQLETMKTYNRWEQIHMARIYLTGDNRQGYDFELKRNPDPLQQWKTTLRAIWYVAFIRYCDGNLKVLGINC